jgi:predicted TIM-barrel fold metal-dependent hydrolase
MHGKIALEEHFNLPEFSVPQYVNPQMMKEISRRLLDVSAMRLGEMDAAGIDYSLLSLNAPGVQGEPDAGRAVAGARQVNDTLAEFVAANPTRYGGLATLPMPDPAAADWFDNAAISENDRVKIGRSNSEKLFRLKLPVAA